MDDERVFTGWFLFYHVEGFLNFIYSCYAKPSESHTFHAHTLQFFRRAHSLEVYAVWCRHMIMVRQEDVWSWAQCSVYPSFAGWPWTSLDLCFLKGERWTVWPTSKHYRQRQHEPPREGPLTIKLGLVNGHFFSFSKMYLRQKPNLTFQRDSYNLWLQWMISTVLLRLWIR